MTVLSESLSLLYPNGPEHTSMNLINCKEKLSNNSRHSVYIPVEYQLAQPAASSSPLTVAEPWHRYTPTHCNQCS